MADAPCCPEPHTGPRHASVPVPQQGPAADEYLPRDPADSVLCRTVRKHLPRFLDAAAADGAWTLPTFVIDALQGLAYCGDFTRGFAHFECDRCRTPRIVPFSCQSRLCPTSAGRRMNEFAAYATDRLMPHTDYRQWTISFPWELRRAMAFDQEFARAVYRISGEVILDWIQRAAADDGVFGSYCWTVTGPEQLRLAPFRLLASEGEVQATTRTHEWQVGRLSRSTPGCKFMYSVASWYQNSTIAACPEGSET